MTLDEVRKLLWEECKKEGGAAPWGRKHKVAHSYISAFLRGDKNPGEKILKALKLKCELKYSERKPEKEQEGFLYRHFSEDGELLYVGSCECMTKRSLNHKHTSPWFKEIKRVTVERYETRTAARKAEYKAIKTENPKYNKHGKPGFSTWTKTMEERYKDI